ncbi:EF-Tu/IF-2/RF-3 family GTPase [Nitrososphaera viennensis]|uniref:Elongation factor Tu n=2 Tax=Nitrososphaera viennensis TaxID=1034015 RepID=A0A977NLW1_9ARCH|nr:EF-Tu/IF-2/RF-3 family GTPase [Nitrososphaera viennensis]AIC14233.1 putative translation elongation factor EF Tu-like protein [Nitrososphaera viennensis EN76]UVS69229.1 elongation factor Tu [Nitrososphaera viennensis]
MNSVNFVVLGDPAIAGELGKKGTSTDITIYDRKTADIVYTWTVPITFPDKVQPLMQAVNIAEYAILNVSKLDRFLGEQVLALDYSGIKDGFVLHSYEVDREKLKALLKGTSLANYQFVDSIDQLKQEMTKLAPKGKEGPVMIPVDHAFDVKGVGTVVLGVVRQGSVKAYDELTLQPSGKNVLVKSIQMHDDPVENSSSPARVGLAVKGPSAGDISRGDVICAPGTVKVASGPVAAKFQKSPFFKGELADNQMYMLSAGMQIRPVKVKQAAGSDMLEITPEKPMVYLPGQACVLLKPDSQTTRIIGKGVFQ